MFLRKVLTFFIAKSLFFKKYAVSFQYLRKYVREIQTTTVQKHKQQPKLQIKSVNRFSIPQRSPQNNWL